MLNHLKLHLPIIFIIIFMASKPEIKDAIKPNPSASQFNEINSTLKSSKINEPRITGMLIKKLNLATSVGFAFESKPPQIVEPLLLIPGVSAMHWVSPHIKAVFVSIGFWVCCFLTKISVPSNIMAVSENVIAKTLDVPRDEKKSSKNKPTIQAGMVATNKCQMVLWFCGFSRPTKSLK